ncbi:hypothetical protein GE061_002110 [Apolygus lucorum]|uniref:Peptidase C1A papain C-terminal domain-containing protein n=1 Tax=Apolygus lucorum TaxID=248454 RepID=A0A8S9X871_APOLU|nr:hypothetical protein GE061_002110 [Apolygus lucorum]
MSVNFSLIVLLVSLNSVKSFEEHWEGYKDVYNKSYRVGETRMMTNWLNNAEKVIKHNLEFENGVHSYNLKANHLADLHRTDYLKMIGLKPSRHRKLADANLLSDSPHDKSDLPEEFDWREKGFVTPAWNQESCGSCYAFSVAASVQGQMFKTKGQLEGLSQQQIVDCSVLTGNLGCGGGSFKNTLRYIELAGLMKESDYPYNGKQNICKYTPLKERVKIKTWKVLPARDEEALKAALVAVGPISVSLNASPYTFQLYHSGVYDDPDCPDDTLNHAMLLVGYTKNSWIIKNWWTDQWGEKGYMHLRKGRNRLVGMFLESVSAGRELPDLRLISPGTG